MIIIIFTHISDVYILECQDNFDLFNIRDIVQLACILLYVY